MKILVHLDADGREIETQAEARNAGGAIVKPRAIAYSALSPRSIDETRVADLRRQVAAVTADVESFLRGASDERRSPAARDQDVGLRFMSEDEAIAAIARRTPGLVKWRVEDAPAPAP